MMLFVPLLLIVIATNVVVDPANIYKGGYEEKAAALLLSGKNVAGMSDHDERILQEEIITKGSTCPDTLVLGSSRVMTLAGDVAGDGGTCWNHGMSGAGIYDYLAILGMYQSCGKCPKKVILGLDPWVLNENNGETRHMSAVRYINIYEEVLGVPKTMEEKKGLISEKKVQFLSISYFQSSVRSFLKNPKKSLHWGVDFYATEKTVVDENIRYTDGSIEYQAEEREKSTAQAEDAARGYVTGEIYQIEGYDSLNKTYCILLEKMVDHLQKKGVDVCIYLPPYHPYVYRYLSENTTYKNVFAAEDHFLDLAREKKMAVYGSYDPGKIGCTGEDFLDGMHLRRSSMEKVWKYSREI